MKTLEDFIYYISKGKQQLTVLSFLDDKQATKEDKRKGQTNNISNINLLKLESEVCHLLDMAENKKRSLCFYPNGSKNREEINEIRFHFVDIDEGDKEEVFERIMSAPLRPTLVYRGRAGYKILYEVKDAVWDKSSEETLEQSVVHFKNIQQQLIEYFKGDGALTSPSYALRMPFTKNYKYWREKVYEEEVVLCNTENVYSQQELCERFPPAAKKHKLIETVSFDEYPDEVQKILETIIFYFERNGIEYVDREEKLTFHCPIHEDTNASAFMSKDKLIFHCSTGACAIGGGKPLDWVAEELGWEELAKLFKSLNGLTAKRYLDISLSDMEVVKPLPASGETNMGAEHISKILELISEKMCGRGLVVNEETNEIYKKMLQVFFSSKREVKICPLEPGGGKSTLMNNYLEYMLQKDIENAGTLIVVERIETAKKLAKDLGEYRTWVNNRGDLEHYVFNQSSYVLESAYSYEDCIKKLPKFEYGICRGCSEKVKCLISRNMLEQRKHPIVIMTHMRLKMESDDLSKYKCWENVDGQEYRRNIIVIDEKPPLVEVNSLSLGDFDQLKFELLSMGVDIDKGCLQLIKEAQDQLMNVTDGKKLEPFFPDFSFPFVAEWYKKYIGEDVELLKRVEHFFQYGGWGNYNKDKRLNITTKRLVNYKFNDYNVVILDGTSCIDMEYKCLNTAKILNIPRIRCFTNLTFCNDTSLSLSKSTLRKNPNLIEAIVGNVKNYIELEQGKVLLLCYKSYRKQFSALLGDEIKKGTVCINHYGNVKGSNAYSDCTALFLAGIPHKGDPYYINKFEAVCNVDAKVKIKTINHVRRFDEQQMEIIKLNDQLVDAIQDILRISLRNGTSTAPVKVYIPTKDQVFMNLLLEYFKGASVDSWNILGDSYPHWHKPLEEKFLMLNDGEKIRKAMIRDNLGLKGEAGRKKFKRIQHTSEFRELTSSLGIVEFNRQTYIRYTKGAGR